LTVTNKFGTIILLTQRSQTGYGSTEVLLKTLREKADAYIEKPLNIVVTRETIERMLYRSLRNRCEDSIDKRSEN